MTQRKRKALSDGTGTKPEAQRKPERKRTDERNEQPEGWTLSGNRKDGTKGTQRNANRKGESPSTRGKGSGLPSFPSFPFLPSFRETLSRTYAHERTFHLFVLLSFTFLSKL